MSTIAQPFDFTQQQVFTKQRGLWSQAFMRLRQNRLAVISGAILGFILLLSILAEAVPAVRRYDYDENDYSVIDQKPSMDHFMGTDNLGRDMWSRLLQGTLFSLKIGFLAEAVVVTLGISFGMLAALGGKKTDQVVVWITDMAYAFPDLLMIILFRQVLFGRDWPIIGAGDPQVPGFSGVLLATVLAISFGPGVLGRDVGLHGHRHRLRQFFDVVHQILRIASRKDSSFKNSEVLSGPR